MPINSPAKIVSVKEQLDDLQGRFDQMMNDESMMDLIKDTHDSALQNSKHAFKEYTDSYTKSQILSIETEKNLAVEDVKQVAKDMSQVLHSVSIVPLQNQMLDLTHAFDIQIKSFERKIFYMNIMCVVSLAAALLGALL